MTVTFLAVHVRAKQSEALLDHFSTSQVLGDTFMCQGLVASTQKSLPCWQYRGPRSSGPEYFPYAEGKFFLETNRSVSGVPPTLRVNQSDGSENLLDGRAFGEATVNVSALS